MGSPRRLRCHVRPVALTVNCLEPRFEHTILRGLVSLPDRCSQWRAAAGIGTWLGVPLLLARVLGRAGRTRQLHQVARWWGRGVARHLAIRLEIDGLNLIDRRQGYIVTPLHEGFADALALLHL